MASLKKTKDGLSKVENNEPFEQLHHIFPTALTMVAIPVRSGIRWSDYQGPNGNKSECRIELKLFVPLLLQSIFVEFCLTPVFMQQVEINLFGC